MNNKNKITVKTGTDYHQAISQINEILNDINDHSKLENIGKVIESLELLEINRTD